MIERILNTILRRQQPDVREAIERHVMATIRSEAVSMNESRTFRDLQHLTRGALKSLDRT